MSDPTIVDVANAQTDTTNPTTAAFATDTTNLNTISAASSSPTNDAMDPTIVAAAMAPTNAMTNSKATILQPAVERTDPTIAVACTVAMRRRNNIPMRPCDGSGGDLHLRPNQNKGSTRNVKLSKVNHRTALVVFIMFFSLAGFLQSRAAMPHGGFVENIVLESMEDMHTEDTPTTTEEDINNNNITVYHLGWDDHYGQTNNQLVAILHALDRALDEHGGELRLNGAIDETVEGNNRFVIAVSGWALKTLGMFLSEVEQKSPMENKDGVRFQWVDRLGPHLPIVTFDQLNYLTGTRLDKTLAAFESYKYIRDNNNTHILSRLKERRVSVLGRLLSLVPSTKLDGYERVMHQIRQRNLGETYVTIHVRALDGQCKARVGPHIIPHECFMHPVYIKTLLTPHFGSDLHRVPIVIISDMQMQFALKMLQEDPDIGPNVIIPQLGFQSTMTTRQSVVSDMMIAARSHVFIGPRVSSMTVIIGQMRVALGADPATNLIYLKQQNTPHEEEEEDVFDVCGDCVFFCNQTEPGICGVRPIYA